MYEHIRRTWGYALFNNQLQLANQCVLALMEIDPSNKWMWRPTDHTAEELLKAEAELEMTEMVEQRLGEIKHDNPEMVEAYKKAVQGSEEAFINAHDEGILKEN